MNKAIKIEIEGELFNDLDLLEGFYETLRIIKKAGCVAKSAKKRAANFCLSIIKKGLVKVNKNDLLLLKSIVS